MLDKCPKDKISELLLRQDKDGDTALHYAAANNYIDIAKILLENCPDNQTEKTVLSRKNMRGMTAYNLATYFGHTDIGQILKTKSNTPKTTDTLSQLKLSKQACDYKKQAEEILAINDSYKLLNVKKPATEQQINSAFKKFSLLWHADRLPAKLTNSETSTYDTNEVTALTELSNELISKASVAKDELLKTLEPPSPNPN